MPGSVRVKLHWTELADCVVYSREKYTVQEIANLTTMSFKVVSGLLKLGQMLTREQKIAYRTEQYRCVSQIMAVHAAHAGLNSVQFQQLCDQFICREQDKRGLSDWLDCLYNVNKEREPDES